MCKGEVHDVHKRNCCSVECCHIDLNERNQELLHSERIRGKDKTEASVKNVATTISKYKPSDARRRLVEGTRQHLIRCLESYDTEDGLHIISNEDRLKVENPFYYPQPPLLPSGVELKGTKETYLDAIATGKKYPLVVKDRELFKQNLRSEEPRSTLTAFPDLGLFGLVTIRAPSDPLQNGIFSEGQLQTVYDSFESLLNGKTGVPALATYFNNLLAIQDHFDTLQPAGQIASVVPVVCAMQMRVHSLFRDQMIKLGLWIEQEWNSSKVDKSEFEKWWLIISDIHTNKLSTSLQQIEISLKCGSASVRTKFEDLQRDPRLYEIERGQYYQWQRQQAKQLRESSLSLTGPASSAGSSSASAPNNFQIPTSSANSSSVNAPHGFGTLLFEEPKQMRLVGEGERSETRRREQRRRGYESIGSSMSSITLDDRPSTKRLGKCKGKGKGKNKDKDKDNDTDA